MKINYDSRLVNFAKEARLLSSMGFKLAPQIIRTTKMAEDFMQQAKELELVRQSFSYQSELQYDRIVYYCFQVADFHNNIGDSILPCLKPLMLEAARSLSSLLQEQNVVTWDQADNVNAYIRRLQQAMQRLTALNQQLTACHGQIEEKVMKLCNDQFFLYTKRLLSF